MLAKILIFLVLAGGAWFGFRYIERLTRLEKGERKRDSSGVGERSFSERIKRATRQKRHAGLDDEEIEETEKCAVCGTYVSVVSAQSCGKSACPY